MHLVAFQDCLQFSGFELGTLLLISETDILLICNRQCFFVKMGWNVSSSRPAWIIDDILYTNLQMWGWKN